MTRIADFVSHPVIPAVRAPALRNLHRRARFFRDRAALFRDDKGDARSKGICNAGEAADRPETEGWTAKRVLSTTKKRTLCSVAVPGRTTVSIRSDSEAEFSISAALPRSLSNERRSALSFPFARKSVEMLRREPRRTSRTNGYPRPFPQRRLRRSGAIFPLDFVRRSRNVARSSRVRVAFPFAPVKVEGKMQNVSGGYGFCAIGFARPFQSGRRESEREKERETEYFPGTSLLPETETLPFRLSRIAFGSSDCVSSAISGPSAELIPNNSRRSSCGL